MSATDFLLGLGGILGGAGQFASAFNIGSNRNAPSGNTQYWTNRGDQLSAAHLARVREDNFIRRRVADATAAGLHPLFALGATQSQGVMPGATTVGGDFGPGRDFASMGYGAANMMGGLARLFKRRTIAETESAETKAKNDKLELEMARRYYNNVALPGLPGYVAGVDQIAVPVQPVRPTTHQIATSDGSIIVEDPDSVLAGAVGMAGRDMGRAAARRAARLRNLKVESKVAGDVFRGRGHLRRNLIRKYGKREGLRRYNKVIRSRVTVGP